MKHISKFLIGLIFLILITVNCTRISLEKDPGPLRVSEANPRYFTNNFGRAVYLTGAHTWNNLVDMGISEPPEAFDYEYYLDWLKKYNHNFFRLWAWETLKWNTGDDNSYVPKNINISPQPWLRTGPGLAVDGKPKFDLTKINPAYIERLQKRVELADDKEIYVSIMLFEGWALQFASNAYVNHPFHPINNINEIKGDLNDDGKGIEIHELQDENILEIQKNYIKAVIDAVNDYDNVLYEISNENHPESTDWQYAIINFIKEYERTLPNQHPVGMTFQYKGGSNETLFESPADWISPNREGGYRDNPPSADGSKVIIADTDHLGGIWGNQAWVWKSFLRGLNPIFMDCYDNKVLETKINMDWVEPVRKSLGYTLNYANKMDLLTMLPDTTLVSTKYCLANKGKEYLVYKPENDVLEIDLSKVSGTFSVEWFNPNTGEYSNDKSINGGEILKLLSPFGNTDAVVFFKNKQ
jgi:hypothetical protein